MVAMGFIGLSPCLPTKPARKESYEFELATHIALSYADPLARAPSKR